MGLATIDPHGHKEQTKLYNVFKSGENVPNSKQDIAIWKCQNLQRNAWPLNGCISVKTSLINTTLGDFVNLGVPFLTVCCLAHNLQTRTKPFSDWNQ